MPESLLQKAMKKVMRTGGVVVTKDEVELVEAMLDGRVVQKQAADALGLKNSTGVGLWAFKVLTALHREGRLAIHDTPGK